MYTTIIVINSLHHSFCVNCFIAFHGSFLINGKIRQCEKINLVK